MIKKEEIRLFEQKYQELRNTYRYLVNANVKLVDENKELKRRIEESINMLLSNENKASIEVILNNVSKAIKILEGRIEYEYEEEKDKYMAHY